MYTNHSQPIHQIKQPMQNQVQTLVSPRIAAASSNQSRINELIIDTKYDTKYDSADSVARALIAVLGKSEGLSKKYRSDTFGLASSIL